MPAPPPTKTMSDVWFSRRVQVPNGASTSRRSPTGHLVCEELRERPVGVDLDDELEHALAVRGVRHRERPDLAGIGDREVHVLTGEELDLLARDLLDHQVAHVVGDLLVGEHLDGALPDAEAAAEDLLVVVEELDHQVVVGVGAAEERLAVLALLVGEGEGRVLVEIDVVHVALEDEGLAGGALPFLTTVHQLHALLEGSTQDRLVLVDLDLDTHGLEANPVLVAHAGRSLHRGEENPSLGGRKSWRNGSPGVGRGAGEAGD